MGPIAMVKEYERGVVYRLGHFDGVRGPGIVFTIPFVQKLVRIDMRPRNVIFSEDLHPTDNLTLKIDIEVFFKVLDAAKAVNNVEDYIASLGAEARRLLHAATEKLTRDGVLSTLESIATGMTWKLAMHTSPWGVSVSKIILQKSAGHAFGEVHSN